MTTACPLCDFEGLSASDLRCPNCQQALTDWKNLDHYAAVSHAAGLHALREGRAAEALGFLLKAVVMRPDDGLYLADYGRMLARVHRYDEAVPVLQRASRQRPRDESLKAAILAAEGAAGPPDATDEETGTSTCLELPPLFPADYEPDEDERARWTTACRAATDGEWNELIGQLVDQMREELDTTSYLAGIRARRSADDEEAERRFGDALRANGRCLNPIVELLDLWERRGSLPGDRIGELTALRSDHDVAEAIVAFLQRGEVTANSAVPLMRSAVSCSDHVVESLTDWSRSFSTTEDGLKLLCELWEEWLSVRPSLELALLLVHAERTLDRPDRRGQWIEWAEQRYPDAWQPPYERGVWHFASNRHEEAFAAWDEALRKSTLDVQGEERVRRHRLFVLANREDWPGAVLEFDRLDSMGIRYDDRDRYAALLEPHRSAAEDAETTPVPRPSE